MNNKSGNPSNQERNDREMELMDEPAIGIESPNLMEKGANMKMCKTDLSLLAFAGWELSFQFHKPH
jgi:hypothetical protein